MLHLIPLTWIFVVTLMALAQGMGGSWLLAFFTWLIFGALPAGLLGWLLFAPLRRAARLKSAQGDGGGHAAADAGTAVREEA